MHFGLYFLINIFLIVNCGELVRHYIGRYQNFDRGSELVDKMSAKSCIEKCERQLPVTFAAIKDGECYCGNNFSSSIPDNVSEISLEDQSKFTGGVEHGFIVYTVCLIGYFGSNCDQPCIKCQNSVPCMRNNGQCFLSGCLKESSEKCDMARLFNNVNVAFNRPAFQSSDYRHFVATLAVDGNNNTNFELGQSCSHTTDNSPWLYVDLGSERKINEVIITNRKSTYGRRLEGANIFLSNQLGNHEVSEVIQCGNITNDHINMERIGFNCSTLDKKRYLFVKMYKSEFLTICEMEAYQEECTHDEDCGINERCLQITSDGNNYKRCNCKIGHSKDTIYSSCNDVDECLLDDHNCNATTSTCVNNDGDYSCECQDGYESKGYNKECLDVDECRENTQECDYESTICRNIEGSYRCDCNIGYEEVNGNSFKCIEKISKIDSIKIEPIPVTSNDHKLFSRFHEMILTLTGFVSITKGILEMDLD